MRLARLGRLLSGLAPTLILAACLGEKEVAGGSSETSNGDLIARVLYADGRPAAGVRVLVVDEAHWEDKVTQGGSVALDSHRTDAGGLVRFKIPECSRCNLQIDGTGEGLLMRDLQTLRDREEVEPFRLGLAAYGSIEGPAMRDSVDRVLLSGTTYAAVDLDNGYRFPAVPAGDFAVAAISVSGAMNADSVTVSPGDTWDGPLLGMSVTFGFGAFADWPWWRKIPIAEPTTASDSLVEFPMLVRLGAGNFDFSRGSRRDIRFSDRNGGALAHEVVGFDSAGGTAEVWVRVESARGRKDSLTLLWGKPGAVETSDPPAVFDDFAGAWHLSAAAPALSRWDFSDAGPGRNTLAGTLKALGPSYAGTGITLGGVHRLTCANGAPFRLGNSITVTAWIRPEPGHDSMTLFSVPDEYVLTLHRTGEVVFAVARPGQYGQPSMFEISVTVPALLDGRWHHVAGVWDGMTSSLHIDGLERIQKSQVRPPTNSPNRVFSVGASYYGEMDEIRVSNLPFSPGRVRLEAAQR